MIVGVERRGDNAVTAVEVVKKSTQDVVSCMYA
jgi:hypothetical protein